MCSPAPSSTEWVHKQYPRLRRWLREYMQETDPSLPSTQTLIRIVQATNHASELDIKDALENLYNRGYNNKHAEGYGYFLVALPDYLQQKAQREENRTPVGYHDWFERNEKKDENARARMYGAIEAFDGAGGWT